MAITKPSLGSSNWGASLNATLDELDTEKLDVTAAASFGVRPESFGAVGDGVTDDAAAFNAMFATLAGRSVQLTAGKTYRLNATVDVSNGADVMGYGATIDVRDDASAAGRMFRLNGVNDVTVRGVRFTSSNAASRTQVYGPLALFGGERISLIDVEVASSAGVGIYVERTAGLLIHRPVVHDCYADGVHVTRAARDVTITSPLVYSVADDGVAIVSYLAEGAVPYAQIERVTITDPIVRNISVAAAGGVGIIGAKDVTVTGGIITDLTGANSAGVKVVDDVGEGTHTPENVVVSGTVVRNADVGFRAGTSINATFTGVYATDCRDSGVAFVGATSPVLVASRSTGNAVFGVFNVGSTGPHVIATDLRANGNAPTGGNAVTSTSVITA